MGENDTIKRDCFGYNRLYGTCTGLVELVCKRGKCPFYKSVETYIKQRDEAKERNEERCSF